MQFPILCFTYIALSGKKITSQEFKYDSQAMSIFALKSAVVVATVMSIPDAVALIPSVSTVTSWVLKLVACWTTALIAWFLFCLGLLQVMRLIAGGVTLSERGLKLWRFGRIVSMDSIVAIALEPEYIFTALFSYDTTVFRLSVYKRITGGPEFLKRLAVPLYVPSYFFDSKTFQTLSSQLLERKYGMDAGHWAYLSFPPEKQDSVRRIYKFVSFQRFLLSCLIALGVSLFLVRKACVLYSYNEGLREYRQARYSEAQKSFSFSVGLDPTFAPGWHGLAGSQFNSGDFAQAKKNWEKALRWKPDYVEAKVSLAYLDLQKREFEKTEKLLAGALKIDPYNSAALLNQADLDLRVGRVHEAIKIARLITARESGHSPKDLFMARCLLAHGHLLEGMVKKAEREIRDLAVSQEKLHSGENLTYRLIVGSRIYLALGEKHKALRMARMALKRACNGDTLLLMAEVRLERKEYDLSRNILERCRETMPENPWVYVLAAEVNQALGDTEQVRANLEKALSCKPRDANSLVRIALLLKATGEDEALNQVLRLVEAVSPEYPLPAGLRKA